MPSSRTSRSTASNTFEAYASSETILMRVCSSGRSATVARDSASAAATSSVASRWSWHTVAISALSLSRNACFRNSKPPYLNAPCSKNPSMVFARPRDSTPRPSSRTSARAESSTPPPAKRAGSCCTRVLTTSRGTAPAWETHAPTPPAAAYFASKPAVMSDAEHPTRRPRRP